MQTIPADHPRLRKRTEAQQIAWQRFRRSLVKAAKRRNLELDSIMWNGIRNAWYDGYWSCYDLNRPAFGDSIPV